MNIRWIACVMAALGLMSLHSIAYAQVSPQTEKVAYLGVTAKPVDATLQAQLNLPDGVGLTVTTLDRKGPSANDIQVNDVLQKLDDQILIDAHQLVTLIHLHQPGDTVTLTLIREAKPIQVKIKLGEKERVVPLANEPDHVVDVPDSKSPDLVAIPFDLPLPPNSQVAMSFKDDVYSAYVTTDKTGHKTMTVKDAAGLVAAVGPVDTAEEWGKFSADIRQHLEVMRKMMFQPQK